MVKTLKKKAAKPMMNTEVRAFYRNVSHVDVSPSAIKRKFSRLKDFDDFNLV